MQSSGRGENRKEMKREMVWVRGRDTFSLQGMNHFHLRMRGQRLLPPSPPGEFDSAAARLSLPAGHTRETWPRKRAVTKSSRMKFSADFSWLLGFNQT